MPQAAAIIGQMPAAKDCGLRTNEKIRENGLVSSFAS